jgi:hypothetical protein
MQLSYLRALTVVAYILLSLITQICLFLKSESDIEALSIFFIARRCSLLLHRNRNRIFLQAFYSDMKFLSRVDGFVVMNLCACTRAEAWRGVGWEGIHPRRQHQGSVKMGSKFQVD